jgi:hypothetical protein
VPRSRSGSTKCVGHRESLEIIVRQERAEVRAAVRDEDGGVELSGDLRRQCVRRAGGRTAFRADRTCFPAAAVEVVHRREHAGRRELVGPHKLEELAKPGSQAISFPGTRRLAIAEIVCWAASTTTADDVTKVACSSATRASIMRMPAERGPGLFSAEHPRYKPASSTTTRSGTAGRNVDQRRRPGRFRQGVRGGRRPQRDQRGRDGQPV